MCVSRLFGKPIETLAELKEGLATYISTAGEKLRGENLAANVISIFVQTDRFKEPYYARSTSFGLPMATNDTMELIQYGLRCVEVLYREGFQFKRGGVMLTELVSAEHVQKNLFYERDEERSKKLMTAMDQINARMGAGILKLAVAGLNPRWKVIANHRSSRFTTHWNELVKVRA